MAAKQSKSTAKITVPSYPFDFDNDEVYEPTEEERGKLTWKTWAKQGKATRVDYYKWKCHLVQNGYSAAEVKTLTFSESLILTGWLTIKGLRKVMEEMRKRRPAALSAVEPKSRNHKSKGAPGVSRSERVRRTAIMKRYNNRTGRASRKEFCKDEKITVAYLRKIQNWYKS